MDSKRSAASGTPFMLWISFALCMMSYAEDIPADWKKFIDPVILQRDLGRDYGAVYGDTKFEGDIAGVSMDAGTASGQHSARNVINGKGFRWPGGRVPYHFRSGSTFTVRQRTFIRNAMDLISRQTENCVTFVRRSTEKDYISFFRGISCYSNVGRQGGEQRISLVAACMKEYGDVQHEIMHALGFYHEVSRSDRDDHVFINFKNIAERAKNEFETHGDSDDLGLPYDYESVMHYPFNAFAVDNTEPVIVPKKRRAKIGQNKNLSPLDVLRIQRAYGCETIRDPDTILPNENEDKNEEDQEEPKASICASPSVVPFPTFEFRSVTPEECQGLEVPGCTVAEGSNNCTADMVFVVNCLDYSSNLPIVSSRISALNAHRPIHFTIFDNQAFPEVFEPVNRDVTLLIIKYCLSEFTTSKLAALNIPNLLSLHFYGCAKMIIRKEDFARNCRLRTILFQFVSFKSIQAGTFADLPNLVQLSLELSWTEPFTTEQALYIMKLHCDCEYSWLRKWLQRKPVLITAKAESEVYKVGAFRNNALNRSAIFVPVDCGQPALNTAALNSFQEEFSVNDRCV